MSDSVQSHRWQPNRLPRPWDSPGKNTGDETGAQKGGTFPKLLRAMTDTWKFGPQVHAL